MTNTVFSGYFHHQFFSPAVEHDINESMEESQMDKPF